LLPAQTSLENPKALRGNFGVLVDMVGNSPTKQRLSNDNSRQKQCDKGESVPPGATFLLSPERTSAEIAAKIRLSRLRLRYWLGGNLIRRVQVVHFEIGYAAALNVRLLRSMPVSWCSSTASLSIPWNVSCAGPSQTTTSQ
jgi:hypothetical protein